MIDEPGMSDPLSSLCSSSIVVNGTPSVCVAKVEDAGSRTLTACRHAHAPTHARMPSPARTHPCTLTRARPRVPAAASKRPQHKGREMTAALACARCKGREQEGPMASTSAHRPMATISSPFASLPDADAGPPITMLSILLADSITPMVAFVAKPDENVSAHFHGQCAGTGRRLRPAAMLA